MSETLEEAITALYLPDCRPQRVRDVEAALVALTLTGWCTFRPQEKLALDAERVGEKVAQAKKEERK